MVAWRTCRSWTVYGHENKAFRGSAGDSEPAAPWGGEMTFRSMVACSADVDELAWEEALDTPSLAVAAGLTGVEVARALLSAPILPTRSQGGGARRPARGQGSQGAGEGEGVLGMAEGDGATTGTVPREQEAERADEEDEIEDEDGATGGQGLRRNNDAAGGSQISNRLGLVALVL